MSCWCWSWTFDASVGSRLGDVTLEGAGNVAEGDDGQGVGLFEDVRDEVLVTQEPS